MILISMEKTFFEIRLIKLLICIFFSIPSNYSNFERGRGRGRNRGFHRGGNNINRPPPSLPNWFQNTSSSTSFQNRSTTQSSWQNNNNTTNSTPLSFSGVVYSGNNNPNIRPTQQPSQGNNSTHSVFPWM